MHTKIPATIVKRAALAMALALLAVPAGAGQVTLAADGAAAALPATKAADPATQQRIRNTLGKLPLHFEANHGQTDKQVKFLSSASGYTLFLTPNEAVLTLAARPDTETGNTQIASSRRKPGSRTSMDSLDSGVRRNDTLHGEGAPSTPSPLAGEGRGEGETLDNPGAVLRLRWLNANPDPKISGAEPQSGKSAYFIGSDATKWRSDVAHYAKVHYEAVYPGIDLVYYGNQSKIEYDFVVQPGADPKQIRLAIDGAHNIRLDADGNLILATANGELRQHAPVIYQEIKGKRVPVEGQYVLHANHEVGFQVAAYDVERTLVIDPILQSTYLGGSGDDQARAITIHPVSGEVYVAGYTTSSNFPGTAGGPDTVYTAPSEAFVARLNASLTTLLQATYLGGSSTDQVRAIAIHPVTGDVYVAGDTSSLDFPGTAGGAQATANGTGAFVARLNASLTSLTQATHLTGSQPDYAYVLVIHPVSGDVYVAGETQSSNFPGIAGGADTSFAVQEAFVARLNSALTSLTQATFLGGSAGNYATGLAIHPASGDVYVAGDTSSGDFPGIAGGADTTFGGSLEAFVARLNSALTSLTQATFLGGSAGNYALALAIHPTTGNVYVGGYTESNDFPGIAGGADEILDGTSDAFVAGLNSTLTSITQATFLGGSVGDSATALAIHPISGFVYVTGATDSIDFPSTGGADSDFGGFQEGFVARFNFDLTVLVQATYLGGGSYEGATAIVIHPVSGDVYVAGSTNSIDFPGIAGGADTTYAGTGEAFITRITADLASVAASSADLSLTLTDTPDPVTVGSTLTYTATITNNGPDAASGVALTDTLPAVTFVSATASQGSCAQSLGVVSCSLGALANAASATITIVVTPTAAGALSNTASVTATEADPNAANNSATATSTVSVATDANLALTLSASPSPVGLNSTLTYNHTITNTGPVTASAAVLTHTLPASGISFTSANASQGSCSGTTTVSCTLGALANGASATVTISVTTTATGTLSSSASVASTEPDPNASNNSATATVSVVQTICSNSLQGFASNLFGAQAAGCSVSVGRGAASGGGGGGAFDPFLLAGLALLYLARQRARQTVGGGNRQILK